MKGVSVIICCYNSSERLPKTLEHLASQTVDSDLNWEVIIVNNASTDNTSDIAKLEWAKYALNTPINIVAQPLPGLSNARKKGIEASLYSLIIFCDDDNWLFPNYIQRSFELAQQHNEIGAIGGEGIPVTSIELPNWFESYKEYYACYPQANVSGELSGTTSFLYGAGLIIKKESLQKLESKGFKSFISDRIGSSLISGGDNEMCYALRLIGLKLYYSADLKFYHFIPETRLNKAYLSTLIEAISYSSMSLILYHYALSGKNITRLSWLKDFLYRLSTLIVTTRKSFNEKDSFIRRLQRLASYKALIAIIDLYGNYRKNYKQLMNLKQ